MCNTPQRSTNFLSKSKNFLQIFSFMIDVFTPKRISPDCLFKSNHRQVKISILIPRCAIYLRGMLHTAEIISAVGCTPRKSSPRYATYRQDHLRGVLHTSEMISAVCCTLLRLSPRCATHPRDRLCGMLHTAETTL